MSDLLLLNQERKIRIFISSTFKDMMLERELLLKFIFPRIRKLCKERYIELIEVDLRWGITEEEANQGKVLEICLNEIDNTRPYFIGILGDRYGWVPEREELLKIRNLLENYPWLEKDIKEGLSITDIEMQYGALRNLNNIWNIFFYIRENTNLTNNEEAEDFDETLKLERLKLERLKLEVKSQRTYPVSDYKSLNELGDLVYNDFKKIIETKYPLVDIPNSLEKMLFDNIDFIKTRMNVYVKNEYLYNMLNKHVEEENIPLILYGSSGTGKSALLANWLLKRNKEHPYQYLVFHFCDCNIDSANPLSLLQRILGELKNRFSLLEDIPTDYKNACEALPMFLAKTGINGDWILVLDGINRIVDNHNTLLWLPDEFPDFVKVIISTVPGTCLEQLQKRNWKTLLIPNMSKDERKKLIRNYLGKYSKKLDKNIEEKISNCKLFENPLILRTMLDELRIFGLHESLNEQVDMYISVQNIQEFFMLILKRVEVDFDNENTHIVENLLKTIWASKKGISEQELIEILKITRLQLSYLLNALDNFLISLGGLLNYSHLLFRQAVECRYLLVGDVKREAHKMLSSYFSLLDKNDHRILDELPFQYIQANQFSELHDFLADIDNFNFLFTKEKYDLVYYWNNIAHIYSAEKTYKSTWELNKNIISNEYKIQTCNNLGEFLRLSAYFDAALYFYNISLTLCQMIYGQNCIEKAKILYKIGEIYTRQCKYNDALDVCVKSLEIQNMYKCDVEDLIDCHNIISNVYYQIGNYNKSIEENQKALDLCLSNFGELNAKTAETYNEIGYNYEIIGRYEEALVNVKKSINIYIKLYGENHPALTNCYTCLAWVYDWIGNYKMSMELSEKSNNINKIVYGDNHPETGSSYNVLGTAYYRKGEYNKALNNYEMYHNISLKAFGELNKSTSASYFQIGLACIKLGNYLKAIEMINHSTEIDKKILEDKLTNVAINYNHLGLAYTFIGDYKNAKFYLEQGYSEAIREFGQCSNDLAENYYFKGIYFDKIKDFNNSYLNHIKALELRERIYKENHPEIGISYNAIGKILKNEGKFQESDSYLEKAYKIFKLSDTLHLINE